jgi:hypothetical protein
MEISNTTKTEPQIIVIDTNTLLIQDKSTLRQIEGFMNYPDDYLSHILRWNDIMPVVDKIESITVSGKEDIGAYRESLVDVEWQFVFQIRNNQCIIDRTVIPQYYGFEDDFLRLYDCRKESKIKSAIEAIISFIKWYNNETRTNSTAVNISTGAR